MEYLGLNGFQSFDLEAILAPTSALKMDVTALFNFQHTFNCYELLRTRGTNNVIIM